MICENCGSNHDGSYGSGRFCNAKCARGFSTKHNREEISRKVSKTLGGTNYVPKEKFCLYCGNKVKSGAKKFCSISCQHEYKYCIFINKWLLGLETGQRGKYGVSKQIRHYLFKKYNNSCQKCGWGSCHLETSLVPLCIHHINGDCTNNMFDNLELLCPNCHALTDNFGSLNKNNKITRKERLLRTKIQDITKYET